MRYLSPQLSYYYFRFAKNGLPSYWNSTSDFDTHLLIVTGMVFCIGVPNLNL